MKYSKDIFIIDLGFEILSMLQSIALKNALWINYSQEFYTSKLKEQINMNSEAVKEIILKYTDKLSFIENHYNIIFNSKLSPYQSSEGLLEEIIVRANEVYLSKEYMGQDLKDKYIQKQKDNNIYYFKELINLYETKFNKYNNFEDFFVNEVISFYNEKFNK